VPCNKPKKPREKNIMKSFAAAVAAGLVVAACGGAANAQISDDVVKIGVLTDMSSLYADATGKGSVAAVRMAVAGYGGKVKGKPVEVISADHQNKPDVGVNIARATGTTTTRSMPSSTCRPRRSHCRSRR
jgi:ABC-type branched-subunit amino acid transport system substrate-binding protein